ncbi:MAG: single-stranded DNA-binding protein [Paludibacteraceae bacterium]|nr:single-stranded DNA-binding protein [Paludibacteraceae bacterium]
MNNVTLVGRMLKDPEIRVNNNNAVAKFGIAVNREYKNQEGRYDADFINCVAFGKTAEFIEKYFKKGMRIGIVGRIQTGSYTNKDGQKVYTTEVACDKAEFVENKSEGNPAPRQEPKPDNGFANMPEGLDEELPFH